MKFTQYNTFLAASVLTLCSFTSLNAVAADAPDLFKRCAQDSLNPAQARGRDLWAKTCKYISQRDYDYLLYDDDGKLRARPKYPSFLNLMTLVNGLEHQLLVGAPVLLVFIPML